MRSARNHQLDALRGLAALAVFFTHCFDSTSDSLTPSGPFFSVLARTPLHLVWGGYEAVIFFFTLSGFVLTRGLLSGADSTAGFLVRRVLRIYPTVWLALAIALILDAVFGRHQVPAMTPWFNSIWATRPQLIPAAEHLLLIGIYEQTLYIPQLWTLVNEMRLSIILPLIVWLVIRVKARRLLLGATALSAVGYLFFVTVPLASTVFFVFPFVVGALLSFHQERATRWLQSRTPTQVAVLAMTALILGSNRYLALAVTPVWSVPLATWLIVLASAFLILFAEVFPAQLCFLERQPFRLLGEISYSFYLLHLLVLVAVLHLLDAKIGTGAAILLALLGSVAVSYAGYRLVERPGIRAGRWAARKLSPAPAAAAAAE